jgi:tetrapyrrole methylase family protein/MazG family protein
VKAETSGEVLKNWAQLKAKEKAPLSSSAKNSEVPAASTLDGVPRSLPALLEAYQLTRKAAQVGFDWERVEGVLEKIEEELLELQSALVDSDREAIEEEVGDLLFSLVNLSRFLKLDPEVVLKKSNLKFSRRFREMERDAINSGRRLPELSKEKLEQLWSAAKLKARPQTAPAARS